MSLCPICQRRPAKRFCPAKGEKICAIDCGREREVSIDCPSDCPHLATARRYEREHRKPLSRADVPYPNLEFTVNYVYDRWPIVGGLASVILAFQAQNRELNDRAAVAAIEALAETFRTLGSGIYYEHPPDAAISRALYAELAGFVDKVRKDELARTGAMSLKDSDVLNLLVFLLRLAKGESDGRPFARGFLDFLRAKFPPPADSPAAIEAPRIILP